MNKQQRMPQVFSGLMDEFFSGKPVRFFHDDFRKDEWIRDGHRIPVNVKETDEAYQIEVAAPGLNKEDFKVQVKDNVLSISFEQKEETTEEKSHWLRKEFKARSFNRSFNLGEKIDAEKIAAQYEQGILRIQLAKKEAVVAANKIIEIA